AYSSIFIATPLVADFKERDPQMKALAKRVRAKRAAAAAKGESGEAEPRDAVPGAENDEDEDTGTAGVVAPRARGSRGRAQGKRR
ncbi:protein translocase subunit SecF, partial [Streptomyces klenkii]